MTTTSPLFRCISLVLSLSVVPFATVGLWAQVPAGVNVWTWHNDNGRTGQNAAETTLTTGNVNKTNFGQLCSYAVDGQVYSQPLVLWDSVNHRSLVYVVTQNNSIYVLDGSTTLQGML